MRSFLDSFFGFSKKELNGILVLLVINSLILALPYVYRFFREPEIYDMSAFEREVALFKESVVKVGGAVQSPANRVPAAGTQPEYFDFDPNGLPAADWRRLGFTDAQIRVIHNYEAKGGRFYRKEDLRRIYSISEKEYAALESFIRINNPQWKDRGTVGQQAIISKREVVKDARIVELNIADSLALIGVRGIGPVFASRIIRFRARLGGFYRKEQLKEVYGIDSLKYIELQDLVEADSTLIRKININTATFDDLKTHPYLTYKQMNALIRYREQHGSYAAPSELRKVLVLNEEIIRKIEPYLSF